MLISLDLVTRKKLILVKQIYQRALVQAQVKHSFVDRIFAVISFDLASETLLKAVVGALDSKKNLAVDFPAILAQAETELTTRNVSIPDKAKILHVRNLRNDAQHKAKYPNETDLNDCRTYTRDFLMQTFLDVWGESFESLSLVDAVQNNEISNLLQEAEQNFIKNEYLETAIKSAAAFRLTVERIANAITDNISPHVRGIVVSKAFDKTESSESVFRAFNITRDLIVFQTIGINPQEYLKYKRLTQYISIAIYQDDGYDYVLLSETKPTKEEAEFILSFVTNAVILTENLDEDLTKAYRW